RGRRVVVRPGERYCTDRGSAMVAEGAGTLVGGGAGGYDIVDQDDADAIERWAVVAEGTGDVAQAAAWRESELGLRLADATNTAGRRRDAERSHHQRGLVETAVAETRTVERHREHGDIAGGGDERIEEASHDGCEGLRAA